MDAAYRYIFGPVPSRRFGRSLGVDLLPYKTCTLDCIFCQLGRTTDKTIERKKYIPVDAVTAELEHWLANNDRPDVITLSGSGEPTLHSGFGEVLEFLKPYTVPSVLLTNGALFYLPEVRRAALMADIVKISLSAHDQNSFSWINRPHPALRFDQAVNGQKDFRAEYSGQLWMEVFLMLGTNDMIRDVKKIAAQIKRIQPDRIQLNTVVRPPAEAFAEAVSMDRLNELCDLFEPTAEIIADDRIRSLENFQINQDTILSMLRRRPCTIHQIAKVFGMHINEVSKYLGDLMNYQKIKIDFKNTELYYSAVFENESLPDRSTP